MAQGFLQRRSPSLGDCSGADAAASDIASATWAGGARSPIFSSVARGKRQRGVLRNFAIQLPLLLHVRSAALPLVAALLCGVAAGCSSEDSLQPQPAAVDGGAGDGHDGLTVVDADTSADVAPSCPAGYVVYPEGVDSAARCVADPALQCGVCTPGSAAAAACLGGECAAVSATDDASHACRIPCLRLSDLGLTSANVAGGSPAAIDSCPTGHACTPRVGADGVSLLALCQPVSLDCSCHAGVVGNMRPCLGKGPGCVGKQRCDPAGWSACDAPAASAEQCNGLDDDCDGQTDEEGLPAVCTLSNGAGTCSGKPTCLGAAGIGCDAKAPAEETCNHLDDDCDGQTDEGFLLGGVYAQPGHCGVCGNDCQGKVLHGTAVCDVDALPPFCAIGACDPGYLVKGNGCVPKVVGACDACVVDIDCGVNGACLATGKPGLPAKVCLLPCAGGTGGVANVCGKGASCQQVQGQARCVPDEATCTCTALQAGAQRGCSRSTSAGTCLGVETCAPGQGWVGCSAATPAAEVCNGEDDDCDGQLDDGAGGGLNCPIANPFGVCQGKTVCTGKGGITCKGNAPALDVCNGKDDDCDGVTDIGAFSPKLGLYATIAHCGGCHQACPLAAAPHTLAACQVAPGADGKPKASCGTTCTDGYVDANLEPGDGCECKPDAASDPPGGGDIDCDGVDGDAEVSIFVAGFGNDAWPGTKAQPVASIGVGVQRAKASGKVQLLVAGGSYPEAVQLVAGVSIYGGYAPNFGKRDTGLYPTTLAPAASLAADGVLRCEGIVGGLQVPATFVDGLTLIAPNALVAGAASYALRAIGCDEALHVVGCTLVAGSGAAGALGVDGGNGLPGSPGKIGQKGADIGHLGCTFLDFAVGGEGGKRSCALDSGGAPLVTEVGGGDGGAAICPDYHESLAPPQCSSSGGKPKQTQAPAAIGATGLPTTGPVQGGSGGAAGHDSYTEAWDGKLTACQSENHDCTGCVVPLLTREGGVGNSGTSGPAGGAGSAGAGGVASATGWQSQAGKPGGHGGHGAGGGGGGGGGGVEVVGCKDIAGFSDRGGSGGGGGSGGCAGSGGNVGGGGGGSFAVYVVAAATGAPRLTGNALIGGLGGKGGDGGGGGFGGAGAPGGTGGPSTPEELLNDCAPEGGDGGDGGDGGSGGGGGGGAGGPSFLVGGLGVSEAWLKQALASNDAVKVGTGGKGGKGGAAAPHSGKDGAPGEAAAGRRWP